MDSLKTVRFACFVPYRLVIFRKSYILPAVDAIKWHFLRLIIE